MTDNPHYVTPEEAEKMRCQMKMNGEKLPSCNGPKCMAWRWVDNKGKIWFWAETPLHPTPQENWIPIEEFQINGRKAGKFREGPTHGYCGMVRS